LIICEVLSVYMGESIKESISKSLKFISKPFPLDNIEDINP